MTDYINGNLLLLTALLLKQYDISKPKIESVVFSLVEKSADLPIDLEFDNLLLD